MVGFNAPTAGPGDGLFPQTIIIEATNRSGGALVIGDVVQLDMGQSATEVDNARPGSSDTDGNNSAYNNVIDPATADLDGGLYGVALEAIADNASGQIQMRGIVASVNVAGATVAGDYLIGTNASNQLSVATGTGGEKIIAIAHEADTANIAECLFDGIHGFGSDG